MKAVDRRVFLKRAGAAGVLAGAASLAATLPSHRASAAETSGARGASGGGLRRRGINYDTGTNYNPAHLTRQVWSRDIMRHDILAIKAGLHCNAVQVHGTELQRLVDTAETALQLGMYVWIQPRLIDYPEDRLMSELADFGHEAERLRKRHGGRVAFNVGSEFSIFVPGVAPGDTYQQRILWLQTHRPLPQDAQDRLNALLKKARTAVRRSFTGDLSYASLTFETVDWTDFDIVGVDHYRYKSNVDSYVQTLRQYQDQWQKPVAITEFGCCTYKGAEDVSAGGFTVVDLTKNPPEVRTPYPERSERTQATYLKELLEIFEAENVHAAFPYQFIQPLYPYSNTPRYDLDLGSLGVVKVIRENHNDPESRYRWEAKEAFWAIAKHNLKYGVPR